MATSSKDQAAFNQDQSESLVANLPQRKRRTNWTKQDWNAYLEKLREEVAAGDAPVELYLHGVEILNEQEDNQERIWQNLPTDQVQALVDQRDSCLCPPTQKAGTTVIVHSYTAFWFSKDWE